MWAVSNRFDPRAVRVADRHYSRQKPGSPQFVRAGYNVVLLTPEADALWVTVYQPFVDHAWPGAWECTLFRNENPAQRASDLITQALAATRALWGDPPAQGMITTVDAAKVRSKRDPGHCFVIAGFRRVGETKSGKVVLRITPGRFPPAREPLGHSPDLFGHTKHLKRRDEYPPEVA
jgi:hypothetical protein